MLPVDIHSRRSTVLSPSDHHRACLSKRAYAHLRESCLALADGQHFASVVWAAVFLEALLDDFAETTGLARPAQDDLNGRVQQLQQWSRSKDANGRITDEIVRRCQDIRNTRNRLVHDTGAAKTTLAEDARFIHAGLKIVVEWYCTAVLPATVPASSKSESCSGARARVFVSTITPHSPRQEYFLDELLARLRVIGLEPVRYTASLYDRQDPIGRIRNAIATCRGAIVVGLERTHAYFLRDKEGTPDEREATHRQYASGWLHLEAGIAHALGLDVFVLCQRQIHGDGIFDRSWNSYPVAEFETLDVGSPAVEAFLGHLEQWTVASRGDVGGTVV
jgi:hypothetical protein